MYWVSETKQQAIIKMKRRRLKTLWARLGVFELPMKQIA